MKTYYDEYYIQFDNPDYEREDFNRLNPHRNQEDIYKEKNSLIERNFQNEDKANDEDKYNNGDFEQ